jgi:hypothetical protein
MYIRFFWKRKLLSINRNLLCNLCVLCPKNVKSPRGIFPASKEGVPIEMPCLPKHSPMFFSVQLKGYSRALNFKKPAFWAKKVESFLMWIALPKTV